MAMGGVDIPLRLLDDKVVETLESPGSATGIGTADTSEIIKKKISATRPARERIFELYMISKLVMIIGPAY